MDVLEQARQRRSTYARLAGQFTTDQAGYASSLLRRHPNLSAGLLQALAQAPQPQEIEERLIEEDDGNWFDRIRDGAGDLVGDVVGAATGAVGETVEFAYEQAIKPVIRGTFTLAEGLAQEVVQRPLTAALAAAQGEDDFLGAYGRYGDSALVNVLTGDLDRNTEGGVLGTGFFAGGQAQAESQEERTLTINGRRADIGQAFAGATVGAFVDPGSRLYDAVAGISGFAVDVGLDPLAWVTGGASKAYKAGRLLKAGDAADILRYADEAATVGDSVSRVQRTRRAFNSVDTGRLLRRSTDEFLGGRPSGLTDTVFREVGINDAGRYIPGGPGGTSREWIYFSNTRNLAHGQGARGVVFEFDTSRIDDVVFDARANTSKPAWQVAWDQGEAEFTFLTSPEDVSKGVRSVLIKSDASGPKGATIGLRRALDDLVENEGWQKVDVDGGVKYVRPTDEIVENEFDEIITAAGGIDGARRRTVLVEKASDFFRDSRLLGKLAEADAFTIRNSWSRSMANRLDGDLIRRLGEAGDEASVAEVLLDAVAHGDVTQRGLLRGPGHFVKTNPLVTHGPLKFLGPNGKLSGLAPTGVVSAGSADEIWESAEKLDSLLRQANVEEDLRRTVFNQMVDLNEGDFSGLFDITTDALDYVGAKIGDADMASLKEVAQKYKDELEAFRKYGVDSWGDPIDVPFADRKLIQNFDGETIETIVPTPQITAELNSLALSLPDVADIRRAATKNTLLRKVYTSKGWELTADATRSVTRGLFKPLALLRPAYIVRIGAEEQARLAASHYDGLFNHPFRWLMANVTNRADLKTLSGDNLVDTAKVMDVITKDAHGRLADKVASRGRVFGVTSVKVDDAGNLTNDAYRGWKGELGQLASAAEARKMTELRGNLGEFKDWAMTEGRESIERLARVNDEAASLLDFGADFDQWAAGLAKRVEAKTAGFDEDIVQRVIDQNLPWSTAKNKQAKNADAAFHSFLSAKARQGINPAKVKVEHITDARMQMMDRVVDGLFDVITGKPTSRLARFPTFRQAMVRRGEELMDALDSDDLRRRVVEAFENNMGLTDDEFRRIAQAAQDAAGSRGVVTSIDEFDDILINKAAQDAKDLLFDVTRRGAAQEAMVAVLPFLDAWKEVTQTWAHLLTSNPAFFIRAQAGYKELRDQGTFYVNEYGQEVFRYPGGGFLSTFVDEMNQRGGGFVNAPMAAIEAAGRTITGDTPNFSVAPEGSVQGINMVATGVGPGFGPVIQWAASAFDTPDTQRLREFIAPFGTGATDDPEDLLDFGGVLGGLAPAWLRKAANSVSEGGVDERQWNSMVGDAMRALVASGEYDPSTDSDRLLEDAKRYAEYQLLFRAGTQFGGPTGATMSNQAEVEVDTKHPDWNPENDPSGRMFFLGVMREDYHRLKDLYGWDVAAEKFYEMYGIEPFYITQGKTTSQGRELPSTERGQRWMEANSEVVDDLPLVAGFFAPTGEPGEYDLSVLSDQITTGRRKSLTPEEQQALANKARARAIWARVQQQTESLPPAMRESARANAKGQLEALHPGWQVDIIAMPRAADKIMELERAANDPRLDDNPLTQPLREYMALRQRALDMVRVRSGSPTATLGRQDAAVERRQLMTAGVRLAQQYPTFMGVWTTLLKNELMED